MFLHAPPKGLTIVRDKLDIGDYSVRGFEREIVIERKSLGDLYGSCFGDWPRFLTELDLYLDAPKLAPEVVILGITSELTHNLHSYPLNLQLAGDVTFLDDGRLQIEQISQNKLALGVDLGGVPLGLAAGIYVAIPAGDTFLNYISTPIKP